MSSFAAQVALSILLSFTALGVALVLPPTPAVWGVSLLLGMVAVFTCPSPP
jgi:hypothetical protein